MRLSSWERHKVLQDSRRNDILYGQEMQEKAVHNL